jgi:uncharacterized protein with FMN-binding domain
MKIKAKPALEVFSPKDNSKMYFFPFEAAIETIHEIEIKADSTKVDSYEMVLIS